MARSMGYAQQARNCRALKLAQSGHSVTFAPTHRNNNHLQACNALNYRRCLTNPEILPPIPGPPLIHKPSKMRDGEDPIELVNIINQEEENEALDEILVTVNISGREYKLRKRLLITRRGHQHPYERTRLEDLGSASNLADRQSVCHVYDQQRDIFCFFGCTVSVFEAVLAYHWNGVIHAPREICSTQFLLELEFWKVPQTAVASCCKGHIFNAAEGFAPDEPTMASSIQSQRADSLLLDEGQESVPGSNALNVSTASINMEQFTGVICENYRRSMWKFLEDFTSSLGAKIFAFISVLFALGSIVIMIIGSIPDFQEHNKFTETMEPNEELKYIELVCVCWFCLEYLLRLVVTVERWIFIKGALQIIDLLTILPSLMEMLFEQTGMNINKLGTIKGAFLALRLLRVLRVMRVFRLARYHTGLKQLGETLGSSKRELSVLAVFFTTTVLLFATSIYYLEKDVPNTKFVSIPAACWWCVITITTVGYGDLVPETVGGQLVATVACLAGIIVLAFPITMIIENFNKMYRGMDDEPPDGTVPRVKKVTLKF